MIIGDFNGKIERETLDQNLHRVMGNYGERNNKGEGLILFCIETNFYTSNKAFQYYSRRLYTWSSPGITTKDITLS